jgi:hypothetical protein
MDSVIIVFSSCVGSASVNANAIDWSTTNDLKPNEQSPFDADQTIGGGDRLPRAANATRQAGSVIGVALLVR